MLSVAIAYPDGPDDVRELANWLKQLPKGNVSHMLVLGKTEGPATLNDFSRNLALAATDAAIAEYDQNLLQRTVRLFSTGCEGLASPITLMMAEIAHAEDDTGALGLAIGSARSDPLPATPRCDRNHVLVAAATVERAMVNARLTHDQVSLVLIKSPVFTSTEGMRSRHMGSTGSSRGAAALGAGIALRTIDAATLSDDPVGRDSVYASRVMSFSGVETNSIEVIIFGERPGGDPGWKVHSVTISDFLDAEGMAGFRGVVGSNPELVFFKAGIAPDGRLGAKRTTVLSSELPPDKQLRAAASGFITAHFGSTPMFVSGGTEHQASHGGCICAALYRVTGPASSDK